MIYLDNAATTPLLPLVREKLLETFESNFGNNSSKHFMGEKASIILESSREKIAKHLNVQRSGIYFTSGATESANILIQGYYKYLRKSKSNKNEIIISSIEHSAVYDTAIALKAEGAVVKIVPCVDGGIIDEVELLNSISENTAMISIIHTNNETGVIQDISRIAKKVKEYGEDIFFMTDVVQALAKVNLNLDFQYVNSCFASGHKIGAPKGIGFFYLNNNFRISPILYGGGQEKGLRSGTTNTIGAYLMEHAVKEGYSNFNRSSSYISDLKSHLLSELTKQDVDFILPFAKSVTSPYIISIAFPKHKSEDLVRKLSKRDICVSTTSACSNNSNAKSRVLINSKLPYDLRENILRISLNIQNTPTELSTFVNELRNIITK